MSQPAEKTKQKSTDVDDGLSQFFLVVTPGFETLAEKEIIRVLASAGNADHALSLERGGLTVRLPLAEGCELNRVLKIPTRILLRLTSFGCRDFPKLFKKAANLNWSDWVAPGSKVEFQASSHQSRLSIKKRIEETCRDGHKKAMKDQGVETDTRSDAAVDVFVRFDQDVCTFSLDTSGELLHKRGTKILSAEAPLRETIAAALLEFMSDDEHMAKRSAGVAITLIDPMAGSGTFLLEAAEQGVEVTTRSFAFETIPNYLQAREAAPRDAFVSTSARAAPTPPEFARFIGVDLDGKAAQTAAQNWSALGDDRPFQMVTGDIFDLKPFVLEGDRWLITNPPYGERLKVEGRLKDYYEQLFETCERVVKPSRACFLLPDKVRPEKLRFPERWHLAKSLTFQNGGLPVTALLFDGD